MSPRNRTFGLLGLGLALAFFSGQAALPAGSSLTVNQYGNSATFGTPTDAQNVSATAPTAGTVTRVALDIVRIQCDVAVYVYVPGTATALNGELVFAGDTYTVVLPAGDATLSYLPVSGTASCTHWKVVAP